MTISFIPYLVVITITGVVLLRSVHKIRAYLLDNKEKINIKVIWLHSISFSLLLLSAYFNAYIILSTNYLCDSNMCYLSFIILFTVNLVSSTLLGWILWDLGTEEPQEEDPEEAHTEEEEEEDYEEQEAIQAKIWNQFLLARDAIELNGEVQTYRVDNKSLRRHALLAS
jgi:hypothetical protein